MKIDYVLLIFSLIAYINSGAVLKAKIETEVKKKSLATTDEISVTISNSGDEQVTAGTVTGFSLVCSSPAKTVQLSCPNTAAAIAAKANDVDGTATVKCKPAAAEDTEGTYVLTAAANAAVNSVAVTVDTANSKNVILSATAESNTQNQTQTQTPSGSSDSGNYHKMPLVLFTIIALLF